MSTDFYNLFSNNDILDDRSLSNAKTSNDIVHLCFQVIENKIYNINSSSNLKSNIEKAKYETNFDKNINMFFPDLISIYLPFHYKKLLEDKKNYKESIFNLVNAFRRDVEFFLGINLNNKTDIEIFFDDNIPENKRIKFEIKNIESKDSYELKRTTRTRNRKKIDTSNNEIILVHQYKDSINEFILKKKDDILLFGRLKTSIPFGNGIYMNDFSIVEDHIKKYLSDKKKYNFMSYIDVINKTKKYFSLDTQVNNIDKYDLSRLQMLVEVKDFDNGIFEIINFNSFIETKKNNDTNKIKAFEKEQIKIDEIVYPHPKTRDHKIFFTKKIATKKTIFKVNFFYKNKELTFKEIDSKDVYISSSPDLSNAYKCFNLNEIYAKKLSNNDINLKIEIIEDNKDVTINNFSDPIIIDKEKNYTILGRNKKNTINFENVKFKISDDIYFMIC
jgi:hypothetical protein